MTLDEIFKFQSDFKSIVYKKSEITDSEQRLKNLHAWDKNDSHKTAILKELDVRKELLAQLKEKLNGKSYDEWKVFSKKLSGFKSRLNRAVNQKEKLEKEINDLIF